jgi:hypothetical protein
MPKAKHTVAMLTLRRDFVKKAEEKVTGKH